MEIHCATMIRDRHHQAPLDTTTPSSDIPKHLKYVYTTMDVHGHVLIPLLDVNSHPLTSCHALDFAFMDYFDVDGKVC